MVRTIRCPTFDILEQLTYLGFADDELRAACRGRMMMFSLTRAQRYRCKGIPKYSEGKRARAARGGRGTLKFRATSE